MIRVFVRAIEQSGYVDYVSGVDNDTVGDVETANGYDDTVLERIDRLMSTLPSTSRSASPG